MTIKKGDKVKWKWGQGYAEGVVENVYQFYDPQNKRGGSHAAWIKG